MWENWNPEDDVVAGEEDEGADATSSSGPAERLPCMVTEVVSGTDFFLQVRVVGYQSRMYDVYTNSSMSLPA